VRFHLFRALFIHPIRIANYRRIDFIFSQVNFIDSTSIIPLVIIGNDKNLRNGIANRLIFKVGQ